LKDHVGRIQILIHIKNITKYTAFQENHPCATTVPNASSFLDNILKIGVLVTKIKPGLTICSSIPIVLGSRIFFHLDTDILGIGRQQFLASDWILFSLVPPMEQAAVQDGSEAK